MLVEQLHQSPNRDLIQIDLRDDLEPLARLGRQVPLDGQPVLEGTHQEQAFPQLFLPDIALRPAPKQFLLQEDEPKTDSTEKDDDRASGLLASKEGCQDENDRYTGAAPEEL